MCEPDPRIRAQKEADPLYRELRWVSQDQLLGDSSIQLVVVECAVWDAIPLGKMVIGAGIAEHNVHANPKGAFFKLGLLCEINILLGGPSNAGLVDP